MKVKELIKILKTFDPELEVKYEDWGYNPDYREPFTETVSEVTLTGKPEKKYIKLW